jgi:hypothetical protein
MKGEAGDPICFLVRECGIKDQAARLAGSAHASIVGENGGLACKTDGDDFPL